MSLERLSVPEAARRLGKSQTQLRRQLAAGTLAYEREELPNGQVRLWLLLEDLPPAATEVAVASTNPELTDAPLPWFRLLDALTAREEEIACLHALLAEEQAQARALRASLEASDAVLRRVAASAANGAHLADAVAPALPKSHAVRLWWARLTGA